MKKGVCKGRAGFTLVELLVAGVLMSLVMGAVYTMFYTAMSAWNNAERDFDQRVEARGLVDRLERDLGNLAPGVPYLFEGGQDEVTMFVNCEPLSNPDRAGARLLRVRYRFEPNSHRVVREEALVTAALPLEEDLEGDAGRGRIRVEHETKMTLAEHVKAFELGYVWMPLPAPRNPEEPPVIVDPVRFTRQKKRWGYPQGVAVFVLIEEPDAKEVFPAAALFPMLAPNTMHSREELTGWNSAP